MDEPPTGDVWNPDHAANLDRMCDDDEEYNPNRWTLLAARNRIRELEADPPPDEQPPVPAAKPTEAFWAWWDHVVCQKKIASNRKPPPALAVLAWNAATEAARETV